MNLSDQAIALHSTANQLTLLKACDHISCGMKKEEFNALHTMGAQTDDATNNKSTNKITRRSNGFHIQEMDTILQRK